MAKYLDQQFLPELLRAAINKKAFLLVLRDVLKNNFIPEKSGYREVWAEIIRYFNKEERPPTIGVLNQKLGDDDKLADCIAEIKAIVKIDYEALIKELEEFIRQNRFIQMYEEVGDLYNKGDKEKSLKLLIQGSTDLANFTLRSALHDSIFGQFSKRHADRLFKVDTRDKTIPLGIDMLDLKMNGGPQRGEATLCLGDSGVGKSQLLIFAGISAARRGFKVAHFQAEGTRAQVLDRYDAAWTGTLYRDMKVSNIPDAKYKTLMKLLKKIGGEIYVEARERFGSWNMAEIRSALADMVKTYGPIDLVLIDYLDLVDPGDGKVYRANEERFRQQATAKLMKDIAVEFDAHVFTVTQASAVPPEAKESIDFVLTRWNIAEDKGKIRPFDNFFTLNQTRDEKRNKVVRIFADKLREHDTDFDVIQIAQNLARARFYDRVRTIEELYDDEQRESISGGH